MGISRESFGQIRDILRKLDDSIDSVREKRLEENERRLEHRLNDGPTAVGDVENRAVNGLNHSDRRPD